MHQTTHFFNLGYGWLCKHCSAEDSERKRSQQQGQPRAAQLPLAKWVQEEERQGMVCTRCGIFEQARKPK